MSERENLPTQIASQDVVVTTTKRGSLVARGLQAVENTKQKTLTKNNEVNTAEEQYRLGLKYDSGDGVPQDDEEAVKWYQLAAAQGHARAQSNLGTFFCSLGDGAYKDDKEAITWFRKAAEQGDSDGQFFLGLMYRDGTGVPQNDEEAVKWYLLAADQGNLAAQNSLGNMYYLGHGISKNYEMAVKWYRLAAEQGHADSQYDIGVMYRDGTGLPQDDEEALKYFQLAADQGNTEAQKSLTLLKCFKQMGELIMTQKKLAALGDAAAQETLKNLNIDW